MINELTPSTDITGKPIDATGEAGVSVGVLEHPLVDDDLRLSWVAASDLAYRRLTTY
jgi:hypothetical protein